MTSKFTATILMSTFLNTAGLLIVIASTHTFAGMAMCALSILLTNKAVQHV